MLDTITRWLEGVASAKDRDSLRHIFGPLGHCMSSQSLTSAGLAITTGGAATASTGSADWYGTAGGVLVKVSATTTLPALTGLNITAGSFNVFCFFVDSAGTVTVLAGTEGTTLAGVALPQFPARKALLGFLIVTYASAFIGGTTPLDTATTAYINLQGAFDPSILVG